MSYEMQIGVLTTFRGLYDYFGKSFLHQIRFRFRLIQIDSNFKRKKSDSGGVHRSDTLMSNF